MRKAWILAFFLFAPALTSAQIVINEVAWMGAPVEGFDSRQWWRYEWLELHNLGDAAARLDGWTVELRREEIDFNIPMRGVIEAHGYFLVGASSNIPGADVSYANLTGKFANTGQQIVLRNAAGAEAEELDARASWFAGDNDTKLTMERRFPERDANDPENWGPSQRTGGTPKAQNTVFGKERSLAAAGSILDDSFRAEKKEPFWSSSPRAAKNPVFMRALFIALVSVVAILTLRRYLLAPR